MSRTEEVKSTSPDPAAFCTWHACPNNANDRCTLTELPTPENCPFEAVWAAQERKKEMAKR